MHEDEEEEEDAAERREEARSLQRAWARAEAELVAADNVRRLEGLGARVSRELRTDWRVWLLACAYAGRLTADMGVAEAKAAAQRAMQAAAPLLHWGGAHGAFLYGLAREYGRGARARGGERSLQSWMDGRPSGGQRVTRDGGVHHRGGPLGRAVHCRGALGGAPRRVQVHLDARRS